MTTMKTHLLRNTSAGSLGLPGKSVRHTRKPTPPAKLAKARELVLQGVSDEDIAFTLGINRTAVYNLRNGITKGRA